MQRRKQMNNVRVLTSSFIFFLLGSLAYVPAYAVGPGFYMGLMGGPSVNNGSDQQAVSASTPTPPYTYVTAKPRKSAFGSRFFMGYQINPYAGVEGGLIYFSTLRYTTSGAQACGSTSMRVRGLDLSAKGTVPIGNYFDVFGKAGVAAIYTTQGGGFNDRGSDACKNQYSNKFSPVLSVGASYNLSQSWVADLSWNRVSVGGKVRNVDMYALGISYHFTDQYCGQFLCG